MTDSSATGPLLVSVLVATYQGEDRIDACLASLLDQSLSPAQYEIVVVQNGPAGGTPAKVRALRQQHPEHILRLVETPDGGAAQARNLGLDAARAPYVTIVDDDDWVSHRFLETLLGAARPGVVPTTLMCDIPASAAPGSTEGSLENYVNEQLMPYVGATVPAADLPSALSLHAGKLLPTALARQVRYDTTLASGEDFVFLARLHALAVFDIRVLAPSSGAVYYRTLRESSLSRRELGYEFAVTERLDCITALAEVDDEDRASRKVVDALTRGQSSFIVRYLEERPEERARVVSAARAAGITSRAFWSMLNRGQARDLALLYLFPPFQDTSALVAARRLRDRGLITDVISQNLGRDAARDSSANLIAIEQIGRHHLLPGEGTVGAWGNTATYAAESVAVADELAELNGAPYRSVYTRAMAPHSHFAGALMKLRHPEIRWVAEFSDPLHYNAYGQTRVAKIPRNPLRRELGAAITAAGFDKPASERFFEWAEIIAYALADEIVYTNENQRRFMLDYTRDRALAERAGAISSVSHHPTLPAEFYRAAPFTPSFEPGTVNIAYFGAFYLTRGLTEVTSALGELSTVERSRVRLHVYTADPVALRLEVLRAGLPDVIVTRPYLPFLEFLAATTHFDALLVNDAATRQHHDINPYLPSKLSDYLGSGSPIWSIVEPGSVLSSMTTEYRSTLGDVAGALAAIRSIISAGPRRG